MLEQSCFHAAAIGSRYHHHHQVCISSVNKVQRMIQRHARILVKVKLLQKGLGGPHGSVQCFHHVHIIIIVVVAAAAAAAAVGV